MFTQMTATVRVSPSAINPLFYAVIETRLYRDIHDSAPALINEAVLLAEDEAHARSIVRAVNNPNTPVE